MDRTSWIALIVCFALLIFYQPILFYFFPEWAQPVPTVQPANQSPSISSSPDGSGMGTQPQMGAPNAGATGSAVFAPSGGAISADMGQDASVPEELVVLSDELSDIAFTNRGGAIKWIALREHKAIGDQLVTLNEGGPIPILAFSGWGIDPLAAFNLVDQSANSITYQREVRPGLIIQRRFELNGGYGITLIQTVLSESTQTEVLPPYQLSLGTFSPIYHRSDERRFVGMAWHNPLPGGSFHNKPMTSFDPGFLGFGGGKSEIASAPDEVIQWAALKTQFFTLIVNFGDTPATRFTGVPQKLPGLKSMETGVIPDGIRGWVDIPGFQVNSSFQRTINIYAGPKEDHRLRKMTMNEDRLMQFGIFGIISRPMLMLMNGINSFIHNYGISIILMTIILRGILWYPQTKANLSMKRMQAVAPLMKDIQEKFKDKPEKMNAEMMKLYQDYGVNPFGGCLPLLIQFPIFLGFYYMLLASIELRHAEFLWIKDLAQPDTVFHIAALEWIPIFNGNINPMPLVMAVTMYISMSITPQPAGVDNPMMKVMKIMPVMFLVFCYNFASALSVYWTMQNLLSIVQMKYNMKQEPPTLEALKQQALERKKARKDRAKGFGMSSRKPR